VNAPQLQEVLQPLPRDRVLTLRTLLRLTDELRAHVLGGRLEAAAAVQARRESLLHHFFAQSVEEGERQAMMEACAAMLDMEHAVLAQLELGRAATAGALQALARR
jgi:hypothetical protein